MDRGTDVAGVHRRHGDLVAELEPERARELIAAGGRMRCLSARDGMFAFRVCPPDGGLDGSVLLMTLPRSAVLGDPDDN